jgi:hypothetical protein
MARRLPLYVFMKLAGLRLEDGFFQEPPGKELREKGANQ